MPTFSLRYAVDTLEGAARVFPQPEAPGFVLRVRLCCKSCGEAQAKASVLADAFGGEAAKVEVPGSRGLASLVQKCGSCASVFTLDVTSAPAAIESFTAEMAESGGGGASAFFCTLECRGCEPVAFEPAGGWAVEGSGGTLFENVDLVADEFAEFDERGDCPVTVSGLKGSVAAGDSAAGKKGKR